MQYRKLTENGDSISALGYGCMRFPTKGDAIDEKKAEHQMLYAYNNGVNYYDTAYFYHNGHSEEMLGKFIEHNNLRDKIYIADKLPVSMIKKPEQIEEIFNTQLKRLDTDHIDYYLMHCLTSYKEWTGLKDFGILEFIDKIKASGQIRFIGFSFHGQPEEFIKIVEDYKWDFCQIQFNYIDENNQAGLSGLLRAHELGLGVIIMEPLRGGNLAANAPDKVKERFLKDKEKHSPAYWGLRWVWNHKEVSVVLSGMNVDKHIKENIEVANISTPNSMSESELNTIEDVKKIYQQSVKVPCTGCNYCMPCPFGVDIPGIFADYNNKSFFGGKEPTVSYVKRELGMFGVTKSSADLCRKCGKCETHCPQSIHIRDELQNAHNDLDNKFLRAGLSISGKLKIKKK